MSARSVSPPPAVAPPLSRWKAFRYLLEAALCRAMAWFIPKLPRRWCMQLGHGLGELAFRLDARGRAVALANLQCAFGTHYTEEERREITRLSYRNFARTMMDLFWAPRLTAANYRDWLHVEGVEELREEIERTGRGAMFLCIHQGNWEWASLLGGFTGFHLAVVAETFKNPRLTTVFNGMRESSGQEVIPQENSLLRMLKIVKRKGLTGMMVDLNLRPSQAATVIEAFGGLKMCVPLLHSVLGQRVGAQLVPIETLPQEDGGCRVVIHPALAIASGATLQQITQQCWDAMEPFVRAHPETYLWAYKHFRYRPRGATRPYPPYANESGKFEKLLQNPI